MHQQWCVRTHLWILWCYTLAGEPRPWGCLCWGWTSPLQIQADTPSQQAQANQLRDIQLKLSTVFSCMWTKLAYNTYSDWTHETIGDAPSKLILINTHQELAQLYALLPNAIVTHPMMQSHKSWVVVSRPGELSQKHHASLRRAGRATKPMVCRN